MALLLALLVPLSTPAAARDRIALIIGNGAYTAAPALEQPVNDAIDLAAAFGKVGFDVIRLTDLDGRAMRRAFREFEVKAGSASVAVVYFTGHGVAVDGVNYLLPVDARLARDSHIDDEGIPLSRLTRSVADAADLRLVLVDAARRNPQLATISRAAGKRVIAKGLVRIEPGAATVVFSNEDGAIAAGLDGRNGPFAAAVLGQLDRPDSALAAFLLQVRRDLMAATGGDQKALVIGPTSASVPMVPDADTIAMLLRPERSQVARPSEAELADAFRRAVQASTVEAWDTFLQFCTAADIENTYCIAATMTRGKLVESGRGSGGDAEIFGDGSGPRTLADRLDVPKATIVGEDAAERCDRLAAHTHDADKPDDVDGTALGILAAVAGDAIAACAEAVEANPGERRYAFELGRAHHAASRFEEARVWYGKAAEAGSAIAMNNTGLLYATGSGVASDFEEARRWFEQAAEAGNVAAMGNLAALYRNGRGVDRDLAEARRWYAKAAEGGSAVAMDALALLYQDGAGGPADLDTARSLFEQAVALGDSYAMLNLGRLYNYGRGVDIDYDRASRLYRDAAALGNSGAMVGLGLMAELGQGGGQDYAAARDWYREAAAQDDPAAMTNLGLLYHYGRGVAVDLVEAAKWYEWAARAGDAAAMANLAYMYEGGRGVRLDKVKAREWYLKGAEGGNGPAMASLGYLYANGQGGPVDYDAALEWYRRGAEVANAEAMTNLGFMYENAWGVEQDFATAFEWYEKGAEGGNAIAMTNIGLMYENGRGVETDVDEAFRWYRRGADAGNASAMASLAFFYTNALGTAVDNEAAIGWYTKAAGLGNVIAMHNLGVAYKDGTGTARDTDKAVALFLQAMAAGNSWTFDQFRDQSHNYPVEVLAGIERFLVDNDYLAGTPDGVVTDDTRAALTAYQEALGG